MTTKEQWDNYIKEAFYNTEPKPIELPPMGLKAWEEWQKILKEFTKDCKYIENGK